MKYTRMSERELEAAVDFAYGGGVVSQARKARARAVFRLITRRGGCPGIAAARP